MRETANQIRELQKMNPIEKELDEIYEKIKRHIKNHDRPFIRIYKIYDPKTLDILTEKGFKTKEDTEHYRGDRRWYTEISWN